MSRLTKHNHFTKLLLTGVMTLLITCVYSCGGSSDAPKEEKKDTATMTAPVDTSAKVKADTTKSDTSGKGGQPSPGGH
ncbi:MAG TPA: hypothetical protein VKT28_01300 [Puia sp.]|nr:hypothetical protein [Puia sp.]